MYKFQDYVFILVTLFFCISLTVFLTINSVYLYHIYIIICKLGVEFKVSNHTLLQNYHSMVYFIQNPFLNVLGLSKFSLSNSALSHFKDVRKLILLSDVVLIISSSYLLWLRKSKNLKFLLVKTNELIKRLIISLSIITVIVLLDFHEIFIYFHILLFSNQNWYFNPKKDPIINVLPDQYFLLCFTVALIYLFLLLLFFYWKGTAKPKK
ncbi:TIGR01906 family membrane protein [Fructilactobacillus vespulae]|uniref:TIGR01906 family membrane protein n=1 Tax=Fructilactobacillus vespulae TaxID=1249630 RepID=UPI0039B3DA55